MKNGLLRKLTSLSVASIVVAGALVGCGSSDSASEQTSDATVSEEQEAEQASEETTEEPAELEPITVAASATPHAEILEAAKDALKEQGYDLQVTVFDDYVQPNEVVEAGEFDANYFQHIPYLNSFNEEHGTHLVDAGDIHYEPFGIYPGTKSSLEDVAEGDVVAIPNDTTNEARALLLLQDNGLLTLKDGVGLEATVNDITENPYNLDFEELEAAQVARVVDEVAYVVLNGNYALEAGYSVAKDSIAYESTDSVAAETYVNIIAVYEGHENDAKIQALVSVLKSDEIKKFIEDTYDGAVVFYDK
ncbi:MAG: MetQ/NlpA family ABC transporter substrate-binding protein [Pseudobutyrivibrio sp.]|nr:MetQ/NlpA family ABC transporter substrate-binding protein [Pseudobutyrivibrio sp.]